MRSFKSQDQPLRQVPEMRQAFPSLSYAVSRGGLVWRGALRPTPDSASYDIRIVHDRDRPPKVYVDRPRIRAGAPHLYPDGRLCLYWPKEWKWSPQESLAETIVSWSALWLYYYEGWKITGEWLGPSAPHGRRGK